MANTPAIPTVDLLPFFASSEDADGKKKKNAAMEMISRACSEYGFFQVVNHGVPLDLMSQAMRLSKAFFEHPEEEKLKCSTGSGAPLPAGYSKQPENSADKNEYLLMFPPDCGLNVLPSDPPEFRDVFGEMFKCFVRTGELIECILNECLGLPPNFLKQFSPDRSWDFMVALHYFPATEAENNGITEHEDGNIVTFVFQDECGLQVQKDGAWIPVVPTQGSLVVNVGDTIQVLTNNKFKSASHRVVRPQRKDRHSFAFFYNVHGDKWVEPLPQFTEEIAQPPKYRGFLYKDYQALRMRNKTHPPARSEDVVTIKHYAIPSE